MTRPALDPGVNGPSQIAEFPLTIPVAGIETVTVTVVGPGDAGNKLSLAGAPYPLVIFSPDDIPPSAAYLSYARRLGSYGIVTVLQTPRSSDLYLQYRDDTRKLIDWLLTPSGQGADRVMGRIDPARIGVTGHGLGGKISLLVAASDPRIKAVIGIDPVDRTESSQMISALDQVGMIKLPKGTPLGLLGETGSQAGLPACALADRSYEALYGKAPSPAFALTFPGAGHNDFLDDCIALQALCDACAGSGTPRTRTHDLAVKYVTAYFLLTLSGRAEARAFVSGSRLQDDVSAGLVMSKQK